MGAFQFQRERIEQPRHQPGRVKESSLTKGLIRAWNHGANGFEPVAARSLKFQSSSVFSQGPDGITSTTTPVTTGGVSGTDCGPIHELESISAYSVFSLATPNGLAVRQALWSNGGTMGLGCGYTTSSRVFSEPIADGGFQTEGVTGFFADGVEIAVGYSYDNAITAGRCMVYKNGQLSLQSNPSGTGNTNASLGTFSVGGTGSSQFYTWKGKIRLTLIWNRALTAAEHAEVARNPWFWLEDETSWVGTAAGASGATGLATEADSALALAAKQVLATGQSSETDTALGLAAKQILATGLASETDTALALAARQITAAGFASETDTAQALAPKQIAAVGLATDTDTALALSSSGSAPTGLAIDTETALARAGVQIRPVGLSLEVEQALALSAVSIRVAGLAVETDMSLALTSGGASAFKAGNPRVWWVPARSRVASIAERPRVIPARPRGRVWSL